MTFLQKRRSQGSKKKVISEKSISEAIVLRYHLRYLWSFFQSHLTLSYVKLHNCFLLLAINNWESCKNRGQSTKVFVSAMEAIFTVLLCPLLTILTFEVCILHTLKYEYDFDCIGESWDWRLELQLPDRSGSWRWNEKHPCCWIWQQSCWN